MSRNLAGEIEMAGCPAADVVGGWRAGADQGGPSEIAVVEGLMMQCRMTRVRKKCIYAEIRGRVKGVR